MFEEAYKQQPLNEELGAQTFFANVRASQWKFAQQVPDFACCYQKLYHYIRHLRVAIIVIRSRPTSCLFTPPLGVTGKQVF